MDLISVIRILCDAGPSLGTAVVNGLLAWATMLGGFTALGSGVPAALFALDTTSSDIRSDLINRGLGVGFRLGMIVGMMMFFVFTARLVT